MTSFAPPSSLFAPFLLALPLLSGCKKESPSAKSTGASPGASAAPTKPSASAAKKLATRPAGEPSNADVYWAIIDPHFKRVSIYDGAEVFLRELKQTPEPAAHLLTAHWAVSEISNGGFQQLFSTAAGVLAPEAVQGFRAIGLKDNADLLSDAMETLGTPYPRDHKERGKRLSKFVEASGKDNPYAELERQFFRLLKENPGGFDAVAARYARRQPSAVSSQPSALSPQPSGRQPSAPASR